MWLFLQAAPAPLPGGYGAALLQSVLALAGVLLLAWVVLRFGARAGLGAGQRLRVLERLPLDARRSLHLVQLGKRVWIVGTGDGAAPSLVAELEEHELPELAPARSFVEVLRAARGEAAKGSRDAMHEAPVGTSETPTSARTSSSDAPDALDPARDVGERAPSTERPR